MSLTYENLVRGVLLLLLIIGSLTDRSVHPHLTLIAFIVFEFLIRKFEKPIVPKDHTKELAELQAKFNKIDEDFKVIKGDIGIAKIGSMIRRG